MSKKNGWLQLTALGVLASQAVPALAQAAERSQEIHVYGGKWFGDKLTGVDLWGWEPEVDDDVTYGLRYTANFTPDWGLELSCGRTNTTVTTPPLKPVDLTLTGLDVNAIRHFNSATRFVPYVSAGLGYLKSDLDRTIVLQSRGVPTITIAAESGVTLNAAAGAKYFVTDHFLLRLDARYRFVEKVAYPVDNALNTFETTFDVGLRF